MSSHLYENVFRGSHYRYCVCLQLGWPDSRSFHRELFEGPLLVGSGYELESVQVLNKKGPI